MDNRSRDDITLKEIKHHLHDLAEKVGENSALGIKIDTNIENIKDYIERCQDEKDAMLKRIGTTETKVASVSTNQKIINYVLGGTFVGVAIKFVTGLLFATKKM